MRNLTGRLQLLFAYLLGLMVPTHAMAQDDAKAVLAKIGVNRGICVLVGDQAPLAIPLAKQSELTVFVQLSSATDVADLCAKVDAAGLLGTRVYVQRGDYARLHLANDMVDAVLVGNTKGVSKDEVMRVLRPDGRAIIADAVSVKPYPKGTGEWSHPYHGPDNNPQSPDLVARRPFMTHFLAEPWYCPLTQMTVISGGRMFKAFGERASAKPQEPLINKLLAMSTYNGTILWERDLSAGFMIHRNTMIATPTTLFMGDDKSCKLIDAATGKLHDEIVIPDGISDGPVWKWMALDNNVLYAMVGAVEKKEIAMKGDRIRGAGWPWWKYGQYSYGFGKTLMAIDPATKKILWHIREQEEIDGRALCFKNGRIYYYSEGKFLSCLDAKTGKQVWRTSEPNLLEAIGASGAAQHWMLGFASTAYMKVSDDAIFFGGPQRPRIVGVSAKDGKLLWQHKGGNSQLVIRPEGLYTLGEGSTNKAQSSYKVEPLTGKILATFPSRDRCTRATGCADSIFTRGGAGGSTAVFDVASDEPKMGTLAPMRPACTDGVTVAHGYLFWGPWMCACDQTQIGVISLGNASGFDYAMKATDLERFEPGPALDKAVVADSPDDWSTYRKDNARTVLTKHAIPAAIRQLWEYKPPHVIIPTAPVAANGSIFLSGADGIVRALNGDDGKVQWSAYTGGPVKYPPTIVKHLAYIGSGDGWVYCLQADTGGTRWRFRAAPVERMMPVYGSLSSTWPVASGVLVDNGVAYAAAGIFNYDGTHVYALDAVNGKLKWQNNTSGNFGKDDGSAGGVSVQGHLLLHKDAIYMAGGNKPAVASYAVADGKFTPQGQGRGQHLFMRNNQVKATGFPLYWRPDDSHYLTPMELEFPGGVLGITMNQIARLGPNADPKGKHAWSASPFQEIAAVAIGNNAAVVTGVNRDKQGKITAQGMVAIDLDTGKTLWAETLPAAPVAWGLALDRNGRIIVTVMDGRVLAFERK